MQRCEGSARSRRRQKRLRVKKRKLLWMTAKRRFSDRDRFWRGVMSPSQHMIYVPHGTSNDT